MANRRKGVRLHRELGQHTVRGEIEAFAANQQAAALPVMLGLAALLATGGRVRRAGTVRPATVWVPKSTTVRAYYVTSGPLGSHCC